MTDSDLISRLESATEGSADLDEEICRLVQHMRSGRWKAVHDYDYGFALEDTVDGGYTSVPAYTTSVDAALSLVPEGWNGEIEIAKADTPHTYRAVLWCGDGSVDAIESPVKATPALTIVIAALRAREERR